MTKSDFPMHYVCTHDEAQKLVDKNKQFWVTDCGCRKMTTGCKRSRHDVCLFFSPVHQGGKTKFREISRTGVDEIFGIARKKLLVTRPFRDMSDRKKTVGVCFCCDDCCAYFKNREEACDKGKKIAATDDTCTDCGKCAKACFFKARKMKARKLQETSEECYGCGNCALVCPVGSIKMVSR